jgi:VWFA-related protein
MYFSSRIFRTLATILLIFLTSQTSIAQPPEKSEKKDKESKVRTMTIPVSILSKQELREKQAEEFLEAGEIFVKENGEEQTVLSIRSVSNTPLHLAILIQDDLSSNFNLQIEDLKNFIKKLPPGSRVMVAYLRSGTPQIRQKFTPDLEKAANSLRIVVSNPAVAPNNPYEGVNEILERFDALPTGRRAILLISDGYNVFDSSTPVQNPELENAILNAQRRSVAIYSFYSAATHTEAGSSTTILNSQSSLDRLSEETGGRAFFQGTISPISFTSFFRDLNLMLNRQFALTYLSTHTRKGYYKVQVYSTNPEVRIEHPKGYYYRGK